ncbi:TetR/AcrR family transcriptional regulator [Pseudactinotalea terrae]|uniref:TetR/AcrR family transcriptional regulator n=1 Tax=Pseudactinotalea terrae TaxID=1743262 RepID=UPI0012E1CDB5|nr:TetR/AcrR family transcriptional regulator [Pseudactinotalea terrae]
MADSYHHGDLRAQLLTAAAGEVARGGPDSVSLRALAREAGVTHGAPAHHFGDRRGLFTALAAQGFGLLADALADSVQARDFARTAVDYVAFAVANPGHYAVMFRADLLDGADAELQQEETRAGDMLRAGVGMLPPDRVAIPVEQARQVAWAIVHGIASLYLDGALRHADPAALARAAAEQLFG